MNYLADMLKKMRTEKGLTQKDLADLSGIPLASLQRYERGQTMPKKAVIEKLAGCFDIDIAVFTGSQAAADLQYIETVECLLQDPAVPEEQKEYYKTVLAEFKNRFYTDSDAYISGQMSAEIQSIFFKLSHTGQTSLLSFARFLLSEAEHK